MAKAATLPVQSPAPEPETTTEVPDGTPSAGPEADVFAGLAVFTADSFEPLPAPISPTVEKLLTGLAAHGKLSIKTAGWSTDMRATFIKQIKSVRAKQITGGRRLTVKAGTVDGEQGMKLTLSAPSEPAAETPAA